MTKNTYTLYISESSRRKLDALSGRGPGRTIIRANLSTGYFGGDYYLDRRTDALKKSGAWSLNDRKFRTAVRLFNYQVQFVLALALDHGIDPKPHAKSMNHRGVLTYLLSTYLEAVVQGHIRKGDESEPTGEKQ